MVHSLGTLVSAEKVIHTAMFSARITLKGYVERATRSPIPCHDSLTGSILNLKSKASQASNASNAILHLCNVPSRSKGYDIEHRMPAFRVSFKCCDVLATVAANTIKSPRMAVTRETWKTMRPMLNGNGSIICPDSATAVLTTVSGK